ncbi:MAG: hypothetical protein BWY76_00342 [bacterium ADurb.Bin429]|nr:MAG: hypothetical protein BWY76_00342 [bacterium ADurb.Bin429]
MRRLLMLLLALGAMAGLLAQPAPPRNPETTLKLSKSLVAVKVTDVERQITAFGPLLTMLDELIAQAPETPGKPKTLATAGLQEIVGHLKEVPGLNAKGDIWFVFMMPAEGAGLMMDEEDGVADEAQMPEPAAPEMPGYMILPLADPQLFNGFLAMQAEEKDPMKGVVLGNLGLVALNNAPLDYKAVALDLPLRTTRDVAISVQISEFLIDALAGAMPPMAMMFMGPVIQVFEESQRNMARTEAGLAMIGEDLSVEGFVIPVPNSPLAKSTANPSSAALALELAGYLPDDVVYANASGPMLQGSPGLGVVLIKTAGGFATMFLPPDKAKGFSSALDKVMTQCSQGRALGIAPSPENSALFGPSLVAVYRVPDPQAGKNAVRGFIRESLALMKMLDDDKGGPKYVFTPDAERTADQSVDLLRVTRPAPAPAADGKPAAPAKPLVTEARFSYIGQRMLVTLGGGCKEQMTALIDRVKNKKAVYTAGARFKGLENVITPTARGFETYALLDMINMGIGFMPEGEAKAGIMKKMAAYGKHATVISTYQEVKDGALHGELRIPGEQMKFLFTLLNDLAKDAANKPKPEEGKKE